MKARKSRARLQKRIDSYEKVQNIGPAGPRSVWHRPPAKQGAPFVFHKPGSNKK